MLLWQTKHHNGLKQHVVLGHSSDIFCDQFSYSCKYSGSDIKKQVLKASFRPLRTLANSAHDCYHGARQGV